MSQLFQTESAAAQDEPSPPVEEGRAGEHDIAAEVDIKDRLPILVPVWQFERMVSLDFAGDGSVVLEFEAEQFEVVLTRAVDRRAQIRVGGAGGWAVLLAGQAIAQPVKAGQVAEIEVLDDEGRVEIIPFDK